MMQSAGVPGTLAVNIPHPRPTGSGTFCSRGYYL
uniref:Uncharacterized protein n=1 Tax=Anguilla anguilla TaxID=7936 RepID=A0A0E9UG76_ANGAN